MTETTFTKLNDGWNAEPNAPHPHVRRRNADLVLEFYMNPWQFPEYNEEDIGILTLTNCWRYRLGDTNDEGWYRGQCRFGKRAPRWGEFYEVEGDLLLDRGTPDWHVVRRPTESSRHFLFYFRDETFECDADDWSLEVVAQPSDPADQLKPGPSRPSSGDS